MDSDLSNSATQLDMELTDCFPFNSSAESQAFIQRLSTENHWYLNYAKDVVAEYQKFLILTKLIQNRSVPSDAVDQAWHLHLLYTHEYWHVLCKDYLKYELHHTPSPIDDSWQEDYASTLHNYYLHFARYPPSTIWLSPEQRLQNTSFFKRLNTKHYRIYDNNRFSSLLIRVISLLLIGWLFFVIADSLIISLVITSMLFIFSYIAMFDSNYALQPQTSPYNLVARHNTEGGGGGDASEGGGYGACGGCGGCGGWGGGEMNTNYGFMMF